MSKITRSKGSLVHRTRVNSAVDDLFIINQFIHQRRTSALGAQTGRSINDNPAYWPKVIIIIIIIETGKINYNGGHRGTERDVISAEPKLTIHEDLLHCRFLLTFMSKFIKEKKTEIIIVMTDKYTARFWLAYNKHLRGCISRHQIGKVYIDIYRGRGGFHKSNRWVRQHTIRNGSESIGSHFWLSI